LQSFSGIVSEIYLSFVMLPFSSMTIPSLESILIYEINSLAYSNVQTFSPSTIASSLSTTLNSIF
jgi:hypothetical protein